MTEREKIERYVSARPEEPQAYQDALALYKAGMDRAGDNVLEVYGNGGEVLRRVRADQDWHDANKAIRAKLSGAMRKMAAEGKPGLERMNELYYQSLLMDAKVSLDAFLMYVESGREPNKQFYLPRRKVMRPIVKDLERLSSGELDLLTISLPPGVGKSTLAIFYLTWLGGLKPDSPILSFSHDAGIVRGFYDEILRIIDKNGEYRWNDVFPDVNLVSTNAKDLRIDLNSRKRFETFQFSSVGAGNAGKLRAAQLLFCDDLCESIEQAMSKERLDKLWTQYNTDIQQRKTGECKELHIATRWSVHDVIGRLERTEQDYPTGKAKFIRIPALNENDESNFDYPGIHDKFTTERYHKQRDNMDDVNWKALYMNEPIEREGQLYSVDELRRFFELPEREPDAIVAVCDTKAKGSDYCVLPVMYLYGNDVYIADIVCDNGDPGIVEERLARMLVKHKVQQAQFESNSAGWHIAEKIQLRVQELGGRTKITTKPTTANKETKIVVNAPAVKSRCLFLDATKYKPNSDYGKAINMLTSYTMSGRNLHDDVCDALAMSMLYLDGMVGAKVVPIARPF